MHNMPSARDRECNLESPGQVETDGASAARSVFGRWMQRVDQWRSHPWALHRWIALSCLTLMLATWRLWFPTSQTSFPAIPMFSGWVSVPWWVDWLASIGCLMGWAAVAIGRLRLGAAVGLACGLLSIGLNQHRLQPWFYEFQLVALLILVAPHIQFPRLVRVLASSIYVYSAISKLDASFLQTLGPQMVAAFIDLVPGLDSTARPPAWMIWSGPLFEFVAGVLLMWPRTRRVGALMGMVLHTALLSVLGPWGLGHSLGVLLWNVHFLGVMLWLVVSPEPSGQELARIPEARRMLAWSVLVPFLILPLTERWGIWDHWTSWAVYAPHSSRVQVFIYRGEVDRLPQELRALMQTDDVGDQLELEVPIGRWSLQSLGVPIYPQGRFQVGVARSVAQRVSYDFAIRCVLWGPADRFTGRRRRIECPDRRAIERLGRRFWLNTQPREFGRRQEDGDG
ncbi:MAG: hypothetical protein D6753_06085 [Planctomycetota bacterium]|nr:MAG: hypothetical protein D6753_06085 [Planctomycetota bacterium]